MILVIDGQEYQVNMGKASEHLATFYITKSKENEVITLENGRKLDFTKKSVIRTAMKAAMVPFVIPIMGLMYKLVGIEPPKHTKHEDLIDWTVLKMLELFTHVEGDIQINAISSPVEDSTSNVRRVESISTHGTDILRRRRTIQGGSREEVTARGSQGTEA
jgi:hypothetical protein